MIDKLSGGDWYPSILFVCCLAVVVAVVFAAPAAVAILQAYALFQVLSCLLPLAYFLGKHNRISLFLYLKYSAK